MAADGSDKVDVTPNISNASGPDWQPVRRYVRPKGATPLRWSLVPAYKSCTAANRQHGPPLAYGSCSPPVQESDWVTTGSDVNPPAQMQGALRFDTLVGDPATPADEADVTATLSITDVRRKDTLADYVGGIQASVVVRITDRFNAAAAGGGPDSATVSDVPFPVDAPCVASADPAVGSSCTAVTSMDAVVPGAIREGKRTIWQVESAAVSDGGADGNVGTAPNTVFARPGVFVP
jgi:hypothetical protein